MYVLLIIRIARKSKFFQYSTNFFAHIKYTKITVHSVIGNIQY